MMRTECDNCKTLGPVPLPAGWVGVSLITVTAPGGLMAAITGADSAPAAELAGVFCSWQCVGEYATARALLESTGSQDGPQP